MGFLTNLGAKLPPGNEQWSQLANFFPEDSKAGDKFKGGHGIDAASVLAALGALGGSQAPPPPAPPAPDWAPIPQPRFRDLIANAPRYPQQQMPTPAWMQPYMWGGR